MTIDDKELDELLSKSFDDVEPSPEATDRMLAALQKAEAERDAHAVAAHIASSSAEDDGSDEAHPDPVAASISEKLKPKKRPVWKVAIPLAACLVALAVVIGPLSSVLSGQSGLDTGSQSASQSAAGPADSNAAASTSGKSSAQSTDSSTAVSDSNMVAQSAVDAADYTSIQLSDGQKLTLCIENGVAVSADSRFTGAQILDVGTATGESGNTVSCEVYGYSDSGDATLRAVVFEGIDGCYLAQAAAE